MSETERKAGTPEGAEGEVTGTSGAGERAERAPEGAGGSLFKRISSGVPGGRNVRTWALAGSGAVVALIAGVLGVRRLRKRR